MYKVKRPYVYPVLVLQYPGTYDLYLCTVVTFCVPYYVLLHSGVHIQWLDRIRNPTLLLV